jgi:hypothetical protein
MALINAKKSRPTTKIEDNMVGQAGKHSVSFPQSLTFRPFLIVNYYFRVIPLCSNTEHI